MKRIFVVTEGQSETNFVKRVLSPYFYSFEKILIPTTVVTKRDERNGTVHKGGMTSYSKALSTIRKDLELTQQSDTFVTTMFDLYALPSDTPGKMEASKYTDPYQQVSFIEQKILENESLAKKVYFPYIQLHEFEALLFTDLDALADEYFEYDIAPLRKCLENKRNPELINDGTETAPSKRILECIPDYDKATAGVSVLEKIGVEKLCQKCRHFGEWISKLQSL